MPYTIPDRYIESTGLTFGEAGRAWVTQLAARLDEWSQRWSLTLGEPFQISYNYVLPATRADGTLLVLKAGVPHPEFMTEIHALRLLNGHGMVRLIEADPDQGVMLLERLLPGTMLSTLEDDDEATRIAARVMRKLWRPLSAEEMQLFPDLTRWTRSVSTVRALVPDGNGPFPPGMLALGESLLRDLLQSAGETVLLHGDLHHFNILRAEREPWLAIDPKGVAGDRPFDVSALMHNPGGILCHWPDLPRIFARRADILAEELDLDRQRLLHWSVAGMILSLSWSYEEHQTDWVNELPVLEALKTAAGL